MYGYLFDVLHVCPIMGHAHMLFDVLCMHMSVISCTFSVLLQVSNEFDDESFHSYALFSLPFSS